MRRHLKKMYSAVFVLLLSASSAGAASFNWAVIGNAGNAADDTGYGAVGYEYSIATTEVTTAQYVEFLNAVAATDTNELYNTDMYNSTYYKGIKREGSSGSYVYSVNTDFQSDWANRPVVYVSWYDTLRFANWLHNGQPSGEQNASTTEDGAYTFSGETSVSARNSGADYWLPSEDEWYKAAYYDPVNEVYYDYATGSDDVPVAGVDANYKDGGYVDPIYYSTEVGEYDNESPYGTYDQSGNVWEWNEALIGGRRGLRGGSWLSSAVSLPSSHRNNNTPTYENYNIGFRVASSFAGDEGGAVPEPASVGLVLLSVGGLVLRRAKRV